jgi:hypothetical protein
VATDDACIATAPRFDAPPSEPFNRPESIGWHGDFSTRSTRPRLTLSYVDRQDPRGADFGAWRVASCDDVLAALRKTDEGRAAVAFFLETPVTFLLAEGGESPTHNVLEMRDGRLGFRFYGRAMRIGAQAARGWVAGRLESAIDAVEYAADSVAVTIPASRGSLLVVDNWHCLHDRLPQTVELGLPLRRALLCFITHPEHQRGHAARGAER